MVSVPSARSSFAGPITTVDVPASTTSAEIEPADRSAITWFGLVRSLNATFVFARTSTAGAAAVWRTTKRALPAATGEVSLTNAVNTGLPAALKCATNDAFSPPVSVAVALMTGVPVPVLLDAGKTVTVYAPGGRCSGPATVPGLKSVKVNFPLTKTLTGVSGMP